MTYFINDNGEEIQISEEILITRQVASFKNFKIKGDISVSFSVQNNSKNRKTLGYYHVNQVNSPVFSSTAFNLVKNGNILMRGYIIIEEDSGKELLLYFISGNGNWFKDLEFSLRDLRNTRHSLVWNHTSFQNRIGATEGIVFPIVDWMYKGEKGDNFISDALNPGFGVDIEFQIYEYFPCVFIRSVMEAVSNFSGIKFNGDLFTDKFFKTLILTPSEPDIYDPRTEALIVPGSTVTMEAICPDIKALELVKWCCMTFGIIPVFDSFSNTLTFDILDKKPLQGDDWSEYVQEYKVKFDQVQNNVIKLPEADEFFTAYNEVNEIQFGETNIQSEKLDGQTKTLYTSIFPAVYDSLSATQELAIPFIPMYELEDEEAFSFNTVAQRSITGAAIFNGFGFPFDLNSDKFIVRIEDTNNYYTGYHKGYVYITGDITNNKLTTYTPFASSSSGTIYTQRVSKGSPGARVLSFIPSIASTDFNSQNFRVGSPDSYTSLTTVSTAYFYKPWRASYPVLNNYRQGLSYGRVQNYNDYAIEEMYFKFIRGMVTAPTIQTKMLIPEKVFHDFNFDFIYINTGALNGYYYVESIVNYKDSTTLVEVNLLELIRQQEEIRSAQSNYLMIVNQASYTVTTLDVDLRYEGDLLFLEMYTTTINSLSAFGSLFTNDVDSESLNTVGSTGDTGFMSFGGDVVCSVSKAGTASDAGYVEFYKGATLMSTQNFNLGDTISKEYTYTGLTGGETLTVNIQEG